MLVFKNVIVILLMSLTSVCAQLASHTSTTFDRMSLGRMDHERIQLEGFVTQWEAVPQTSTIQYMLRDYWGYIFTVRSSHGNPTVNEKYIVTGIVAINPERRNQRYIIEESRVSAGSVISLGDRLRMELDENRSKLSKMDSWIYDLTTARNELNLAEQYFFQANYNLSSMHIASAREILSNPSYSSLFYIASIVSILFVGMAVTFGFIMISNTKPRRGDKEGGKGGVEPPPPIKVEGNTIKMYEAPKGTLKLLPGRFEVIEGDTKLKEIRLFRPLNKTDLEYTFGSGNGEAYQHIQLSHNTVSSQQAKLFYSANSKKYTIINRADPIEKNATKINGKELQLNESYVLNPNDVITMGIVSLVYKEN
jgi:hypothetical protein